MDVEDALDLVAQMDRAERLAEEGARALFERAGTRVEDLRRCVEMREDLDVAAALGAKLDLASLRDVRGRSEHPDGAVLDQPVRDQEDTPTPAARRGFAPGVARGTAPEESHLREHVRPQQRVAVRDPHLRLQRHLLDVSELHEPDDLARVRTVRTRVRDDLGALSDEEPVDIVLGHVDSYTEGPRIVERADLVPFLEEAQDHAGHGEPLQHDAADGRPHDHAIELQLRLGEPRLAELHGRMDPILKELGYTKGTVGERMQALGNDKRYQFSEGDKGREEIFAFINEQVDYIRAQLPRAFDKLVDPPFEVRRIPIAEELGAPGAYGGAGSKDGTIPGRFWINLRTPDLHRKYDLPDLTFHESFPGHVWEGAYSNRLPLIRSILAFNAFSEGWALYAEQLADELGAYDDFKVGRLGYLQSLAFRACRLVVDTGLHHKRWTREEGNRFFVERNGSKPEEVASEVDRYCSWPGQACGYKIGHSEIVGQRERAQRELGEAYDFKAFNTAVIMGGNAPLNVVGYTVTRYIEQARS